MNLRDLLDLCSDDHMDDWVGLPGERPATAMAVGLLDSGASEPLTTILAGHSIAVYEPDARLSLVWPVPDDDERERRRHERVEPEWVEEETHSWKSARDGWVVVLLNGFPVWQERVWYLDWGSGIGGYVADFRPRFGGEASDGPSIEGWNVSAWAVGLARLVNVFSGSQTSLGSTRPLALCRRRPRPTRSTPHARTTS